MCAYPDQYPEDNCFKKEGRKGSNELEFAGFKGVGLTLSSLTRNQFLVTVVEVKTIAGLFYLSSLQCKK